MEVGQKVKANVNINEDDWWDTAWDEDHEPYRIPEGTEGIVTGVDSPHEGFCTVTFGEIKDVCVTYSADDEFLMEIVPVKE